MNVGRYQPYYNHNQNQRGGFRGGARRHGPPPRNGPGYYQRHPRGMRSAAMREAQEPTYIDWNALQREEVVAFRGPLINITPSRRIGELVIPESPSPALSSENRGAPAPGLNICSTWLARNHIMTRKKKVEAIVLDDDEDEAKHDDDDELVVIEEKFKCSTSQKMELTGRAEAGKSDSEDEEKADSDSDDSIIIIEPFIGTSSSSSGRKKTEMTQLETKMVETRWSSNLPSSSSMATSSQPATTSITSALSSTYISPQQRPLVPKKIKSKIVDGFSKECSSGKRTTRQWTKVSSIANLTAPTSTFTVCSYNVLCQKTIARTGYLYKHLNNAPHFLEWAHRWAGLQEEFVSFDADVLGLQEVQADHYVEHFEPFMKQNGYLGVYKQKFGTVMKDDGCAIFYRPEKFERVGYQEVNYFISPSAISNRENIAQILALRCRVTGEIVLVANTHLLFNEERGDVKLAQLAILFSAITQMRSDFGIKSQFKCSIPSVLVMGDFNMEWKSLVYDFVVKGRVHVDQQPVRTMSGQSFRAGGKLCNAAELLFQTTVGPSPIFRVGESSPLPKLDGTIGHAFKFESAYHYDIKQDDRTRSVSTYHKDKAAPDFIFFTKERTRGNTQKLQVLQRFALPTVTALEKVTPWPNQFVPSDHLPLIVKFQLTKDFH